MQEYRVVIKNDRYNTVKLLQVILLSFLCVAFIVVAYYQNDMFAMFWPMMLCISLSFAQNQQVFNRLGFFRFIRLHQSVFIWAIIGSFFLLPWWLTMFVIIFAAMQFFIKQHFDIVALDQHIKIKSQPEKIVNWNTLQNVVIKDDLLTIDYRSNKIFQAEINTSLSNIGNEADFNEFCRLQINSHK